MNEDSLLGLEFWRKRQMMGRKGVVTGSRGGKGGMSWSSYWKPLKGVLVLTFDESRESQYTTLFPMLQEEGVRATLYITGTFPGVAGCMTWEQIRTLHAAGMDIQGHGWDHTYFDTLNEAQTIDQLTLLNNKFISEGLPVPQHMAYPGGAYSFDVKEWITPYIKTARSVDQTFYPSLIDSDKLSLNATSIDNIDTEGYYRGGVNGSNIIKGYMDQTHLNGGAMILYAHGISEDGYALTVDVDKLRALIQYAKSIGMEVFTIKQLYNMFDKSEPVILDNAEFTITSTGDGSGVATLAIATKEDTVFTLSGNAKFYTNSAGTENESSVWEVINYPNVSARTIYIKCSSGTSTLTTPQKNIVRIGTWTALTNAPSIGGDVSQLFNLNYLNVEGNNTLSGDVSELTGLTRLLVTGTNTLSGSITNLTNLNSYLYVLGNNTLSGDITGLKDITNMYLGGNNTVSGDISGLTKLTSIELRGNNTIDGDLALISEGLTRCYIYVCGITKYTSGGDWGDIINSGYIIVRPSSGYGLSVAEESLLLQEINSTKTAGRTIYIDLRVGNATMEDTIQGGIWGDFDGETTPTELAIAYKNLIRVEGCTILANGITTPGGSGDGTGFPAGFGDWYRS